MPLMPPRGCVETLLHLLEREASGDSWASTTKLRDASGLSWARWAALQEWMLRQGLIEVVSEVRRAAVRELRFSLTPHGRACALALKAGADMLFARPARRAPGPAKRPRRR